MADKSQIEWTDATWNPVRGCVKVSPGCKHCYAETFAERFRGVKGHAYEQGFDLRLVPEKLAEPLRWEKPRRVFVNSMSDLFQDGVPDRYIDQVFAVMALARHHTFQVLTKRAERMAHYFADLPVRQELVGIEAEQISGFDRHTLDGTACYPLPSPNVWLGVSVENQEYADERIPLLLQTPAAVRFISAEPLLGELDLNCIEWLRTDGSDYFDALSRKRNPFDDVCLNGAALDWVIVGGESGGHARPLDIRWVRSIALQCGLAGVPCFVKQLGTKPYDGAGSRLPILSKKGGLPLEWPEDLRVREWPVR